jgi:hypothetical protein
MKDRDPRSRSISVERFKAIWKGLPSFPARTALRITNMPPVRRHLASRYRKDLEFYRPALPTLTTGDRAISSALRETGVYQTSLADLGLDGSEAVFTAARELAAAHAGAAAQFARKGKSFIIVPPERLMETPAIFEFGLSDRMLDIVEDYLGLPAAYDGISINYTMPDGRESATALWHRDWEDRRMVKVAIYLTDIDARSGPFQLVSRVDERQGDDTGFRYKLANSAELEALFDDDIKGDIASCEGDAGSVIFADTARFFHRSKPNVGRDRVVLFYSYFARAPRHPFFCGRSGMTRRQIGELARALPARQRAAVEWWRNVPFPLRLIPAAGL